jgi:hypothetical protein
VTGTVPGTITLGGAGDTLGMLGMLGGAGGVLGVVGGVLGGAGGAGGVTTPTVVPTDGEVTLRPSRVVPLATALSATLPFLTSAAVTTYVPMQVSLAPDASEGCGQLGPEESAPAGGVCVSTTATWSTVTFPVLVTRNEYVIT